MTNPQTTTPARPTRILLIDDDAVFGQILRREARRHGAEIVHCSSVAEVAKVGPIEAFDSILLDYHLGAVTGSTVSSFLNVFFGSVPVAIVSSSSQWWFATNLGYPSCVKTFVHKDRAYGEIVEAAKKLATLAAEREEEIKTLPDDVNDYETFATSTEAPWAPTRVYRSAMAVVGRKLLSGLALISG